MAAAVIRPGARDERADAASEADSNDEVLVRCSTHARRTVDAMTKSLSAGVLDGKGRTDLVALPRRRATFDAIEAIQDQIRRGNLRPGQSLPSERELSEALGVSRPTVLEAVQAHFQGDCFPSLLPNSS